MIWFDFIIASDLFWFDLIWLDYSHSMFCAYFIGFIDWLIDWLIEWMDGCIDGWLDGWTMTVYQKPVNGWYQHIFLSASVYIYFINQHTPGRFFQRMGLLWMVIPFNPNCVFFLFGVNNIRGLQTFFGAKKRWVNLNKTVGPKKCPIEAQERGWNRCVSWNQPSGAALLLGPWYLTACQVKEIGHADAWHGTWA